MDIFKKLLFPHSLVRESIAVVVEVVFSGESWLGSRGKSLRHHNKTKLNKGCRFVLRLKPE